MFVGEFRERDFVPSGADRKSRVVEEAFAAGLCKADKWNRFAEWAGATGAAHLQDKFLHGLAGRLEGFRQTFSRRPAGAAVRPNALTFVESGGIQARRLG